MSTTLTVNQVPVNIIVSCPLLGYVTSLTCGKVYSKNRKMNLEYTELKIVNLFTIKWHY